MWNTSGTREFSTIPDNGKLQLFECVENLLKYSSLNLLGKVKFNSEGGVWGGVGFATAAEGCDGAVREPAAAAIRDGLSRTLVSINAYFEPANAKKKRFAACLLGVFHTFVYQKIGTN